MKIYVADIETFKAIFLFVAYIPEEEEWKVFEISRRRNDIDALMSFLLLYNEYYWVSFNGLRFDGQIVEWMMRNYQYWHELSWKEIVSKIYQKAQDNIDDQNYELPSEYREEQLSIKQLDLFKINHLDNKNRRVSLKRLEFELDMENIEEMPIDFSLEYLSEEEMNKSIEYCKNDVLATHHVYLLTTGNTSHPLYKGDDKIELRLNIEKEFNIKCLNYSDSKIGDEIIKKYYCEEKRISYEQLPKKGFFRKFVEVKYCIAKYIKFVTPQLQNFLEELKNKQFEIDDEFKESVSFYGNTYSFMKGGLHTEQLPESYYADDKKVILDFDVSSFYPAIIINNNQYPYHLGKEFLSGYKKLFERRLQLKPLSKTDKKIKGIVNALKLSVNSVYGKSSDVQSWLYDRQLTLFTTITGELSLMMLIEAYELAGINVISANT